MKNIIEGICQDLASPGGRDLQERCLQSMVLMERFRGVEIVGEIVPNIEDADISPDSIERLADALAVFITTHPLHSDVASATWALGKLREPRFIPLFERVLAANSGYSEIARQQAVISLQDLGHEAEDE